MEFLSALWMPIVVSAVVAWFGAFFCWMVFPHHKTEWKGIPGGESGFLGALVEMGVGPGQYMFPWVPSAEMKNPESMERVKKGPNGYLIVWGGPPNMGKNMLLCILLNLAVGVFVAYVAWHALNPGDPYLSVFRITGAVAVMTYAVGPLHGAIWFGGSSRSIWANFADGVFYGLLTAGVFGWLWPKA